MAKLIVNPTSPSRREVHLPRSLVSIGRDPSNDLVLPDAMVSRRHAVIEYRGSQYFLRDCNSSNGSLVNGDRVSERGLRDGDLVAIGTARLLFREEPAIDEIGAKVVQHPSAPRLQCPSCQADYRKGDLFCRQCGASVAPQLAPRAVCTSCGTAVPLPAHFCNACGSPLAPGDQAPAVAKPRAVPDATGSEAAAWAPVLSEAEASEPSPSPEAKGSLGGAGVHVTALGEPSPLTRVPSAESPAALAAPQMLTPTPEPARRAWVPPSRGDLAQRPAPPEAPPAPLRWQPASFGRRLAAGLIDGGLVAAAQALLLSPAIAYWLPPAPEEVRFLPILASLSLVPLAAALGASYFIFFWGVKGATPGKRLLGLVVQASDGTHPMGVSRAALRLLGYLISAGILGIGFLMIAFTGAGLHDRIADTRVVRRERG